MLKSSLLQQEAAATPSNAPVTRQLRHTRSQTRNSTVGQDGTDADAKPAEVRTKADDEEVDIMGLSSASSEDVDITGSPAAAMLSTLHAALPLVPLAHVSFGLT